MVAAGKASGITAPADPSDQSRGAVCGHHHVADRKRLDRYLAPVREDQRSSAVARDDRVASVLLAVFGSNWSAWLMVAVLVCAVGADHRGR